MLARRGARRGAAGAAALAPTSPLAGRCSSSTTGSCSRGRCAARGKATLRCSRCPARGGRRPGIAIAIDGNGRRVAADPYRGTIEAVLECAANLACAGAEPLGLTNCLNFGNPEKPHIAWQLTESVRGLGDACRAIGVPGRRRQRLALQRGRRGPDLPDAGDRLVGELPDAAAPGARLRAEGDASPWSGRSPRRCAAPSSRGSAGAELPAACPSSTSARVLAAQRAVREAVRDGLARERPRHRRGRARRGARRVLPGRRARRRRSRSTTPSSRCARCSARGRRVRRVSGGEAALRALGGERVAVRGVGTVGGARCDQAGEARVELSLERMREAHGALLRCLPEGRDRAFRRPPALIESMLAAAAVASGGDPSDARSSEQRRCRDGPRDECGVFGVYAPGHDVSRLAFFALYALQHRGQESAGIAAADRGGQHHDPARARSRQPGLHRERPATLGGELAIGHVRYSTTGSNAWANSQPVQRAAGTGGNRREVALAHNGNLINAVELHAELRGAASTSPRPRTRRSSPR